MKYTRYDLKKRKNDHVALVVVLLSVLIASYLLGTGLSTLFIKNSRSVDNGSLKNSDVSGETDSGNSNGDVVTEDVTVKFVAIQNGVFGKKEYADAQKEKVSEVFFPFSIAEEGKTRILSGIYNEEDAAKNIQLLNEKGIPNSKVTFQINKGNLCDAEITEIVSGYIGILTLLQNKDTKAILVDSLKTYVNSLEKVDNSNKNYSALEELKKHVNALPDTIEKKDIEGSYVYIYGLLKKLQ